MCYYVGDMRRAEDQFRFVYDRATKGQKEKKKYLFGSLVGLVSGCTQSFITVSDLNILILRITISGSRVICGAAVRGGCGSLREGPGDQPGSQRLLRAPRPRPLLLPTRTIRPSPRSC